MTKIPIRYNSKFHYTEILLFSTDICDLMKIVPEVLNKNVLSRLKRKVFSNIYCLII